MSLNWDLTAIADNEKVCWIENTDGTVALNPVTNALIWASLMTNIGEITDKTAPEVYARAHMYEQVHGAWLSRYQDGERIERPFTKEDVRQHIGLKTNVWPMETRAKWLKRILDRTLTEYADAYSKED